MGGLVVVGGTRPVVVVAVGNVLDPVVTRQVREFDPGRTVRAYVLEFWPLLPSDQHLAIAIDGHLVPDEKAALDVILGPGQSLVLAIVPGKGGKNIFSMIAQLAMFIIAPELVPATWATGLQLGLNSAFGLSIATSTAAGLISGAISMGGSLLMSAVMGGGVGAVDQGAGTSDLTNSATYAWDSKPNPIMEGGYCPILYGRMRVKPPMVGKYVSLDADGKQVLNLLYLVTDHALASMSDIEINGNPIDFYTNVTTDIALGSVAQAVNGKFTETISEKTSGAVMSTTDVTVRTDGNAVEGLGVLFSLNGLFVLNGSGGLDPATVSITVEHRIVGGGSWTSWGSEDVTDATNSPFYVARRYDNVAPGQYDVRAFFTTAPPTGSTYRNRCVIEGIQEIVYDDFKYPGCSLLEVSALATDKLSNGLPTVTCVADRGEMLIPADASAGLPSPNLAVQSTDFSSSTWTKSAYASITPSTIRGPLGEMDAWLFTDTSSTSGQYGTIRSTSVPQLAGDTRKFTASIHFYAGTSTRVRLLCRSVVAGSLVVSTTIDFNPQTGAILANTTPTRTSLVRLDSGWWRVSAQVTCPGTATGAANDWCDFFAYASADATAAANVHVRGAQVEWGDLTAYCPTDKAPVPSNSPAWACVDLLCDDEYGGAVPARRVVLEDFVGWDSWCASEGHTVNLYVDEAVQYQKLMQTLAICGRGRVDQLGTKYTCVVDRPESIGVQHFLFTVGNIVKDSFAEEFLPMEDRATSVEVTYMDAEANWSRQVVEVHSIDFDASTAPVKKSSYTLLGVTSRDKAQAFAQHVINSNRYLTNTVSFEADIDAIGCMPGDVIDVSHDVPQWGYSGRIVAQNDNNMLTLDRPVSFEMGKTYAIKVKRNDDTVFDMDVTHPGAATEQNYVLMTAAMPLPWPEPGDLYAFGETARTTKQFRVATITRSQDQRRKITALEYVPEVYSDTAPIPVPVNLSSLRMVASLHGSVSQVYQDGITRQSVSLAWRGNATSFFVHMRKLGGQWRLLGQTTDTRWDVQGLDVGFVYQFAVSSMGTPETGEIISIDFTLGGTSGEYLRLVETISGTTYDIFETVDGSSVQLYEV